MVIKLMDRSPVIIVLGGMLLGWIAGTMVVTDPAMVNPSVLPQLPKLPVSDWSRYAAGAAGALLVLALGRWLAGRRKPPPRIEPAAATGGTGLGRILLAVDGSDCALRAARQVLAMREALRDPAALQIHMVNVQRPVSGDVSSFVASKSLQEFHRERSEAELAPARALFDAAGVAYQALDRVGYPGPTIAEEARTQGCDLIVLGTRGQGGHTAALLGSVAQSTIEHAGVPVLLVK